MENTKLNQAVLDCKTMMDNLDIPYSKNITVTVNTRARRRWGQAHKNNSTGSYTIQIASRLLKDDVNEKCLKNTIMHEFLHTIPGCMNHGTKWSRYANLINRTYNYNIQRVSGDKEDVSLIDDDEYKYIFACNKCGQEFKYLRRPKWIEHYQLVQHTGCYGNLVRIK